MLILVEQAQGAVATVGAQFRVAAGFCDPDSEVVKNLVWPQAKISEHQQAEVLKFARSINVHHATVSRLQS